MAKTEAGIKDTLVRMACFVLPACVALAGSYLLGELPLDGGLGLAAYCVAESGSKRGIPVVALLMIGILVSRRGITWSRRTAEGSVVIVVLAAVLGGGAYLNEHVVKPRFGVFRPNILELADKGALGMTAEAFYALGDKPARSRHLEKVLRADDFDTVPLHPLVRDHWIAESGFSSPSGHSLAAMTLATVCLGLGLSYCPRPRLWFFYLLAPWAVMVCYSRPILRVHSPTDVCCGGLVGVVIGTLSFVVLRGILGARENRSEDPRV